MKKMIRWLIPLCAAAVLVVACVNLAGIFMEYNEGVQEYKELQTYVKVQEPAPAKENAPEETAEEETDDFYLPDIDFEALKERNPDFRCWIYIPALELNYPVAQGKDNEEYLYLTFDREKNSAGCIFMDAGNSPDFSDRNTVIYGHNMKNRSMFGSLKRFLQDGELARENPYFYIYTEDEAIRYRIIAYYTTVSGSETYSSVYTDEDYDSYLNMILRKSAYDGYEEELTEGRPNMVMLSTCHGQAGGNGRFVIHGVLEEIREQKQIS